MKISTPEMIRQRSEQYAKLMASANPDAGYTMQNTNWPGLAKVIEESGEVLQICGKIMSIRGASIYYKGEDLRSELEDEVGDLLASLTYLIQENKLDRAKINRRVQYKLARYAIWKDTNQ